MATVVDRVPETLCDADFQRVAALIKKHSGINIVLDKKSLLEGRLRKRVRALGFTSYTRYCDFLFSSGGIDQELGELIDAVTTNTTNFFREPEHFKFLVETALPELIRMNGAGTTHKLNVWSAACSTGEEPYTLAMVVSEFASALPRFDWGILATDLSSKVLEAAKMGVFRQDQIEPIPMKFRMKYLLKSRFVDSGSVRMTPEIRDRITFRRLNLMSGVAKLRDQMDAIFCRNVIIYFDGPTQERIVRSLYDRLVPGGYLFMGHSESLMHISLQMTYESASIYRKTRE
jgi:chemotaxis protein methyltransferase CheR